MSELDLDSILARIAGLDDKTKGELAKVALGATSGMRWVPNPGPQTKAFHCEADELFYGGEPGGGKSDLLVGLSLEGHEKSLILRRTNKEATKLVERYSEVIGSRDGWNGQDNVWRLPGRVIDIGGCQHEDDKQKYKGSPHDLIGFDEVSDFTESQYQFIIIWNRSVNQSQRCRIVAAGNPPTRPEGLWVLRRWAAWLDIKHPNPALPGELRWYLVEEDGEEREVDGPGPYRVGKHMIRAKSRTFIRSGLDDNPDLAKTDYRSRTAATTGLLRRAYHDADFGAGVEDAENQLIPTAWVLEAQKRWTRYVPLMGDGQTPIPMCSVGVDASGGGRDPMILAPRHDGWYPAPIVVEGKDIPIDRIGKYCAGVVVSYRRDDAKVIVDMGGGYGGPLYEQLRDNNIDTVPWKGAEKSTARTKDRKLTFYNKRTEGLWKFREALDPGQLQGSPIALPPDPELVADLTAPTFEVGPNGIKAESKEDVCKRLGRSTDKGDAVVMAWMAGFTIANMPGGWQPDQVAKAKRHRPTVNRHSPTGSIRRT